jgi:hypothetical protein
MVTEGGLLVFEDAECPSDMVEGATSEIEPPPKERVRIIVAVTAVPRDVSWLAVILTKLGVIDDFAVSTTLVTEGTGVLVEEIVLEIDDSSECIAVDGSVPELAELERRPRALENFPDKEEDWIPLWDSENELCCCEDLTVFEGATDALDATELAEVE